MDRLPAPFRAALVLSGLLAIVASAGAGAAGKPNEGLPLAKLHIRGHALTAEVAATEEHRTIGLMYRFSLKPDHGMLFVFAEPALPRSFWMKNTFVPLSIAFIDRAGRIVNIEDMAPQDERGHPSLGPVLYALEMKKGWFAERQIRAGDIVQGLDKVPRARD